MHHGITTWETKWPLAHSVHTINVNVIIVEHTNTVRSNLQATRNILYIAGDLCIILYVLLPDYSNKW